MDFFSQPAHQEKKVFVKFEERGFIDVHIKRFGNPLKTCSGDMDR